MDRLIVQSLERLSQVFRFLLWEYAKEHQLSPIQIQFLIYIASHSRKFSSVSELARAFSLTPATVSDAVTVLEQKGLVQKMVSKRDKRKFPLTLTKAGQQLSHHVKNWSEPFLNRLQEFPLQTRESLLEFLLKMVESLKQADLLDEINTCFSCGFLLTGHEDLESRCILRNVPLNGYDFRLNCANYKQLDPK